MLFAFFILSASVVVAAAGGQSCKKAEPGGCHGAHWAYAGCCKCTKETDCTAVGPATTGDPTNARNSHCPASQQQCCCTEPVTSCSSGCSPYQHATAFTDQCNANFAAGQRTSSCQVGPYAALCPYGTTFPFDSCELALCPACGHVCLPDCPQNNTGCPGNCPSSATGCAGCGPQPPDSIDWRNVSGVSYVTPVLNQGYCGSCWAFAGVGALEAAYVRLGNPLTALSVEEIVDCAKAWAFNNSYFPDVVFNDDGCKASQASVAAIYAKKVGISAAADYANYSEFAGGPAAACVGTLGQPQDTDINMWGSPNSTTLAFEQNDPTAQSLLNAVGLIGPVAIIINSSVDSFKNYGGGVIQDVTCVCPGDHNVLIVGYGTDTTTYDVPVDYWLIKNSWGTDHGDQGYYKIQRGVNMCCVEAYAGTYPTPQGDK